MSDVDLSLTGICPQDNYRYTLAQADPLAGDNWEQELAAGKPLPSKHYRCKLSESVLLALHDKGEIDSAIGRHLTIM